MLRVLSLGAGCQSSALALMAAAGEISPMPDCAVFADTLCEARWTYEWLSALIPMLPFPVYRVCEGSGLLDGLMQPTRGGWKASPPLYTESQSGSGQLRRQCTRDYKVNPITRQIRTLLGLQPGQRAGKTVRVSLWLGISLDEVQRMKSNREPWIENRWPLIEKRMSRSDCLLWMERRGYPKPRKSSCVFCPYHGDREWAELRQHDPEGWQTALQVDELIRGGVRGTTQKLYLHRSLKALSEIDVHTQEERGQLDLWGGECSGYCHT